MAMKLEAHCARVVTPQYQVVMFTNVFLITTASSQINVL